MCPRTLISFDFQLDHYISSRETKGIPSVLKAVLSFPCIRLNKHNKINKHKYLLYTPPNCGSISYIPHCDIPFWLMCLTFLSQISFFSPLYPLGRKSSSWGWKNGGREMMLLWKWLAKHSLGSTCQGRPPCPTSAQHHHFTQFTFHPKSGAPVYKEQREKQAVP